jgi:hypothetical protein
MVGRGGICGVREVELMGRVLKPGPASMEGLGWLARVGPAPLDAWRCAMGWSEVAARSHARRLETEGWLERYPMTRGSGSLFVATRTGVRVLGLNLRPAGPPAPTWVGAPLRVRVDRRVPLCQARVRQLPLLDY